MSCALAGIGGLSARTGLLRVIKPGNRWACDDLDAEYQRLHTAGVQFDSPPQQQPWATEAVLRDPDGNQVVLQQA